MRRVLRQVAGARAPLLAAGGKIAPPALPCLGRALAVGLLAMAPVQAMAELRPLPLHASHCVGALIDNLVLLTTAMVPTTPDAVGRPEADPRAQMFTVPDEDAIFSIADIEGVRACGVAPMQDGGPWSREEVEADLIDMGLVEAPACAQGEMTMWFWPAENGAGRSVSVGIEGNAAEVRELLAFETLQVTNPEECRDAG